jgi:tetratricopeptide (TPR) repeat protein
MNPVAAIFPPAGLPLHPNPRQTGAMRKTAGAMRALWIIAAVVLAGPAVAQPQPNARPSQAAVLDQLLAALQAAPSEANAAVLESRIRGIWLNQGSPAVTLLISRGLRELQADTPADAEADFTAALDLQPDLAEARHQRARARFAEGDWPGTVADIEAALQREPREFAALQSLSHFAESRGDWTGAYDAWRKVMELDPMTPDGASRLQDLRRRALGEEL